MAEGKSGQIVQGAELARIERDYIDFLAERRHVPEKIVRAAWMKTRERFQFGSRGYRELCTLIHELFSPVYGEESEEDLIAAYQFHAPLHTFRMIVRSYRGWPNYQKRAAFLLSAVKAKKFVIVDYGSGLADVSLAIAKLCPKAKIYLVDIDGALLDFAEFRLRRYSVNLEVLRVTQEQLYPTLPPHNICIAWEVMEHLLRPMKAYQNICRALGIGGILMGSFGPHGREMFHVSPDLSAVASEIAKHFRNLKRHHCYQKVR